jgi:undecaprenyl-diphosphatase
MMNLVLAFILGIIQGITEFIPVSSSGHLALIQNFYNDINLGFDVALHLATLFAVLVYFYKDIYDIAKAFLNFETKTENFRWAIFIIVATIPAAIGGFFLQGIVEKAFSSLIWIAIGFLVTGILLFIASYSSGDKPFTIKNTFIIGLAQVLAIFPGVSRSGATISAGLFSKLDKDKAIKFSFLLSIPVIFGAFILRYKELCHVPLLALIIGMVTAFLSALLAIFVFVRFIKTTDVRYFAYYCAALAAGIILYKVIF